MRLFLLAESDVDGPGSTAFTSGFGRTSYEDVIKPRRALSCRHPVNCVAVRLHRRGNVANHTRLRHPASQRHGRGAEASGKATTAAGNGTRVRSGSPPSRASRPLKWRLGRHRMRRVRSCRSLPSSKRGQQLQRWLRIKLQTRQGPLGWMQQIGWVVHGFLGNLQRHAHPQGLRAMRGNRNVYRLGTPTSLVAMHRHAGRGQIPGHRTKSKQGHTIADS